MFDSYLIHPTPSDVYLRAEINERRAPTDESVKLLREMEEKARKEVIAAMRVEDSTVECVLHFQHDIVSDMNHIRAIMKINGQHVVADYRFRPNERREEVRNGLFDAVSKAIAASVLASATLNHELLKHL